MWRDSAGGGVREKDYCRTPSRTAGVVQGARGDGTSCSLVPQSWDVRANYCHPITICVAQISVIQVKELHQGVLGKLQPLHPCLIAEERMGHGHDRVRMEVQGEVERRQNLATQLRNLLGSQLEVGTDTHQPLSEVALLVPATEEISLYVCFREGIVHILVGNQWLFAFLSPFMVSHHFSHSDP